MLIEVKVDLGAERLLCQNTILITFIFHGTFPDNVLTMLWELKRVYMRHKAYPESEYCYLKK